VLIASVGFNIYTVNTEQNLQKQNSEYQTKISSLESNVSAMQSKVTKTSASLSSVEAENTTLKAKKMFDMLDCTQLKAGSDGKYTFSSDFISACVSYEYFSGSTSDQITTYLESIGASLVGLNGTQVNEKLTSLGVNGATLVSTLPAATASAAPSTAATVSASSESTASTKSSSSKAATSTKKSTSSHVKKSTAKSSTPSTASGSSEYTATPGANAKPGAVGSGDSQVVFSPANTTHTVDPNAGSDDIH